jgi:hypothetical protein
VISRSQVRSGRSEFLSFDVLAVFVIEGKLAARLGIVSDSCAVASPSSIGALMREVDLRRLAQHE